MKHNYAYSEFFTSGFRAMTAPRRPSSYMAPPITNTLADATNKPRTSTLRQSMRDITHRRSRPTSMLIRNTPSDPAMKRARRSSIVSFSSRLFERLRESTDDSWSFGTSASRRNSISSVPDEAQTPEVWITAGGPFTPSTSSFPESSEHTSPYLRPIDPFASSPDSKSFFIDLTESPSSPTPKRESFLSFSPSFSPSPDRSFTNILLPSRRERPTSIQTMPLPSRSRRSSWQFRPSSRDKPSSDKYDKYDSWWISEEDESLAVASPLAEDLDECYDPVNVDWRQFHIELLLDDSR